MFAALSTCDPGSIHLSIKAAKQQRVRVSGAPPGSSAVTLVPMGFPCKESEAPGAAAFLGGRPCRVACAVERVGGWRDLHCVLRLASGACSDCPGHGCLPSSPPPHP